MADTSLIEIKSPLPPPSNLPPGFMHWYMDYVRAHEAKGETKCELKRPELQENLRICGDTDSSMMMLEPRRFYELMDNLAQQTSEDLHQTIMKQINRRKSKPWELAPRFSRITVSRLRSAAGSVNTFGSVTSFVQARNQTTSVPENNSALVAGMAAEKEILAAAPKLDRDNLGPIKQEPWARASAVGVHPEEEDLSDSDLENLLSEEQPLTKASPVDVPPEGDDLEFVD